MDCAVGYSLAAATEHSRFALVPVFAVFTVLVRRRRIPTLSGEPLCPFFCLHRTWPRVHHRPLKFLSAPRGVVFSHKRHGEHRRTEGPKNRRLGYPSRQRADGLVRLRASVVNGTHHPRHAPSMRATLSDSDKSAWLASLIRGSRGFWQLTGFPWCPTAASLQSRSEGPLAARAAVWN
jgi:hypothetical protein